MNFLICLVVAAVETKTTYAQGPELSKGSLNELADEVKVLSEILTEKNNLEFVPLIRRLRNFN